MRKIFENVVLAEFATNLGSESFMCFKAENSKKQKERLLKTFFNNLIAPLLNGTEAEVEVKAMKTKEKANFAAAVIDELFSCIIEPNMVQDGETTDVSFAVAMMALFTIRHTSKEPFVCACQAVRLESFAPICCPSLRPDRVRTLAEELELERHLQKLEKWSKVFSKMCKNVCRS